MLEILLKVRENLWKVQKLTISMQNAVTGITTRHYCLLISSTKICALRQVVRLVLYKTVVTRMSMTKEPSSLPQWRSPSSFFLDNYIHFIFFCFHCCLLNQKLMYVIWRSFIPLYGLCDVLSKIQSSDHEKENRLNLNTHISLSNN